MNVDGGGGGVAAAAPPTAASRASLVRQSSLFANAQAVVSQQPAGQPLVGGGPATLSSVPDEASQLLFLKVATTRGYRHVERWFVDAVARMRAEMLQHLHDLRDVDERQLPGAFQDVAKIRHEARNTRDALLGRIAEMHRVVRRERRALTHWQAVFARLALAYTEDIQAAVRVLLDRRRKAEEWTVHGARAQVVEVVERFEVKRAALRERAAREEARELQARAQERDRLRLAFESCMQELRNVVSWHLQAPNRGGKVGQLRRRQLLQILGPAVRGTTRRLLTSHEADPLARHRDAEDIDADDDDDDDAQSRRGSAALLLPPTEAELALQAEERALCAQLRAHRRQRRRGRGGGGGGGGDGHCKAGTTAKMGPDGAAGALTPAQSAGSDGRRAAEPRRVVLPALPAAASARGPPEERPLAAADPATVPSTATAVNAEDEEDDGNSDGGNVSGSGSEGAARRTTMATESAAATPSLAPMARLQRQLDAVEAALVPSSSARTAVATQPCAAATGHANAPLSSHSPPRPATPPPPPQPARSSHVARRGDGREGRARTNTPRRTPHDKGGRTACAAARRPPLPTSSLSFSAASSCRPTQARAQGGPQPWAASTTLTADALPLLGPTRTGGRGEARRGAPPTAAAPRGRPTSGAIVTPATAGGPAGQGFSTEHLMQLLHSLRGELSEVDALAGRADAEAAALLAELHNLRATTAARLLGNVQLERDAAALRRRRREQQSRAAALHAVASDNRLREALDWGVLRGEQVEVLAELRRKLAGEQDTRRALAAQVGLLDRSTHAQEEVLQAMQGYWRRHAAVMRRTSNAAAARLARAPADFATAAAPTHAATAPPLAVQPTGMNRHNNGGGVADEPRAKAAAAVTHTSSSASEGSATTAVLANYSAALAEMEAVTPIPVTSVFSNETPRDVRPQSASMLRPGGGGVEEGRPFCAFDGGPAEQPSSPLSPASATHASSAMEARAARTVSYPATLDDTLQLREENLPSDGEPQDASAASDELGEDGEGEAKALSAVVAIPALHLYSADQVAEFIYSVFEGA